MAGRSNNMTRGTRSRTAGFAAATLFLLLCAAQAAPKKEAELAKLVWPSPPAEPRISHVQTINGPADLGQKSSAWSRFSRWLIGSKGAADQLVKPFGISVDDKNDLCFTDSGANTVCYFDSAKKQWHRWESVSKLRFVSPVGVAKHGDTLFVADSGLQSLVAFDTRGKLLLAVTNGLTRPAGLAIAGDQVRVVDSQQCEVLSFSLDGRLLSRFGSRGAGEGEFNFPTHIASDRQGSIYVTDSLNGRVQVFDGNGKYKTRIGSRGDTPGHFGRPKGVAADSHGHIYVVDALYDNIQIFDAEGRFLLSLGQAGSDRGEFWLPNGIAISQDNRIFVADCYNRRIQVLQYVGGK